jgi:hypothetical protein
MYCNERRGRMCSFLMQVAQMLIIERTCAQQSQSRQRMSFELIHF